MGGAKSHMKVTGNIGEGSNLVLVFMELRVWSGGNVDWRR